MWSWYVHVIYIYYYSELKTLNVLTKTNWTKHNKTIVQSSHPPKEAILTTVNKQY